MSRTEDRDLVSEFEAPTLTERQKRIRLKTLQESERPRPYSRVELYDLADDMGPAYSFDEIDSMLQGESYE